MNMKRRWALCAFLFLLVPSVGAAQSKPAIAVDATSISGTGFNRRREVVIFGDANIPLPFAGRLRSYFQVVTTDDSGGFRWEPAGAVPARSIWFAVDVASSDFAVAKPGSTQMLQAELTKPDVLDGIDGATDALSLSEYQLDVLLVRANDAVWIGSVMRHSSADLNRAKPGTLRFDPSAMTSVRGGKHTPGHLLPSDLVIVIEPVSLRFYAGPPAGKK